MEEEKTTVLERWIAAEGDRLCRLCALLLGDRHLAEDAVQDTFLKAWRAWDRFEERASEKTWLTAIAVNVCRDYRRIYWYRGRVERETLLESIPAPPDAEPMDDAIVRQVLALAPKYREVVLLYFWQELNIREIAEALGEKENTVSTRLRRAKERLKISLKGWKADED